MKILEKILRWEDELNRKRKNSNNLKYEEKYCDMYEIQNLVKELVRIAINKYEIKLS